MRGILQDVIQAVGFSFLDLPDLRSDDDHCLAEAVQLYSGLTFGWLDHQGSRHGERNRRCMVTEIDEALRHVFGLNPCASLEAAEIYNKFMSHRPVGPLVENRIVPLESGSHVV